MINVSKRKSQIKIDDIESDLTFKIITIGDCGVGKTSIFKRLVYNTFELNTISTIGLNILKKDIELDNRITIHLELSDTAGQEKFRSLSKSYFRNSNAILFVFDLNKEESFENIKYWIKILNNNYNYKKRTLIYLIGNKKDLEQKVKSDLINSFLKKKNYIYRSISAYKNDNNEIQKLFKEISNKLYENYMNSLGESKNISQNSIPIISMRERTNFFLCE